MFIVRVVPIGRGVFKDELSFFSRMPLPEGAVVSANVRAKRVFSIVTGSSDVREEKSAIRKAGFSLKNLGRSEPKRLFSRAFIEAAKDTALWHAAHEGAIISAFTSEALLQSSARLEEAENIDAEPETELRARADLLVLQAEKTERIRTYRNLAREAFTRGASVLILCPTLIEAETLAAALSHGIEERTLLVTGEMPKKKLIEAWNRAANASEPLLVVGTPFSISFPFKNLDTVVIERESARSYRMLQRPFADARRLAEYFCRRNGARLLLADFPLRVETRFRADEGELNELARAQARPEAGGATVVDMRRADEVKETGSAKTARRVFRTLSKESEEKIRRELARGGRVAVFAARKGLAPLTVCNDCGSPVSDPETGTPMALYKSEKGNVFISHRSGAVIPAGTPCRVCGGWNLVTLGIGVDRVSEELARAFPEAKAFLFTKDTAPSHKAAKKIAKDFYAEGGALLAGTERMLPFLTEPVEFVLVASVDSILSLSAWRAHEHALSILLYLRERAERELVIETRKPEHPVMKALASGNTLDFYRAEIAERKAYAYPPFATFVGLRARGSRERVEKARSLLSKAFADADLVGPLPAVSEGKNLWSARAVIRVPKGAWPESALAERLKALPADMEVTIDPDEIA